ncbi:MAG: LON peptidase substrate-binding domain-containing protein [Spirochaetaceae bacterium]|nr:LON peptidase substrate-binding domain-containing protein [Spirochaetaceae bacterium]MDE0447973.1 LON peptidase substrate-binding domain-containing protein [Spirochaetaceae bacterium]
MPEPDATLPLFPLNVVLYPRAPLPLHIFEERYKEMVAAALDGEGVFGMVCAGKAGVARVGCTAKIVKVIRRYDDGRMDILTVGMRRFRIARLVTDEAYLQAQVSYFGDEAAGTGGKLVARCMKLYREIYESTPGNLPEADLEECSATVASFYLAYFSDLSLVRKQQFLELTDPNTRLRALRKAFETRLRERQESRRRARRIEGNGHLPPR